MNDSDFDVLLDRYFYGEASARELAALEGLLRNQPDRRLLLAKRSLLEIHLRKAFSGLAPTIRPVPVPNVPRSRLWRRALQGTAAAALCIAVGWLISAATRHAPIPQPIAMAPIDPHDTKPGEPKLKPAEPKATEPKPTEPKATEPRPTEPKPNEPKRESGVLKGAMAGLGDVKNTVADLRKNDGLNSSRPIEPKKEAAVKPSPPQLIPAPAVEPDDGKQGILVPEPKAKNGPRDLRGTLIVVDADRGTLVLRPRGKGNPDRICVLGESIAVFVRGQPAGVGELTLGAEVRLRLADDRLMVEEIREGKD
jgi:hypothetical protein